MPSRFLSYEHPIIEHPIINQPTKINLACPPDTKHMDPPMNRQALAGAD